MNLLVEQLKALRTTMSSVEPEQLDMSTWSCKTVACVCGHQAMSGDLKLFTTATQYQEDSVGDVANAVYTDVEDACSFLGYSESISHSVFMSKSQTRLLHANSCSMLTEEQLKHPHLNTESSPKHVISYIDMLLEVLEE